MAGLRVYGSSVEEEGHDVQADIFFFSRSKDQPILCWAIYLCLIHTRIEGAT